MRSLEANADLFPSTKRNQTESPLLRLPTELRNLIYTFAVDTALLTLSQHHPDLFKIINKSCASAQACEQTRDEMPRLRGSYAIFMTPFEVTIIAESIATQPRSFTELMSLELDPTCLGMDIMGSLYIKYVCGQANGAFLKGFPDVKKVLVLPGCGEARTTVSGMLEHYFRGRKLDVAFLTRDCIRTYGIAQLQHTT